MNKRKFTIIAGVFLTLALVSVPNVFATPITLTGNGLGLSEGVYGPSLAVSSDLTLFAITRIDQMCCGSLCDNIHHMYNFDLMKLVFHA